MNKKTDLGFASEAEFQQAHFQRFLPELTHRELWWGRDNGDV